MSTIGPTFDEDGKFLDYGFIDDGTVEITITTPEGWKCERENCKMDYLHKHTTYEVLNTQSKDVDQH